MATAATKRFSVLKEHTSLVWALAFSPDGRTLATGSWDRTVILWDTATHKPLATFKDHARQVNSVAFSPDGRILATGSSDKTVILWDTESHKPLATLTDHNEEVRSVAFSSDGRTLATGSRDQAVILWDTVTRKKLATLKGHTEGVTFVAFSPGGKSLATGSEDGTVILWDTATHKPLATLKEHTEAVRALSFSPDGRTLATGSVDGTVILWDPATHKLLATLKDEDCSVILSMTFSPDGRTLAAGSISAVILWDTATRTPLVTLHEEIGEVDSVAFSPDGKTLATGGFERTILWDTAAHSPLATSKGHSLSITSMAKSPDGRIIATGSEDSTVILWDTASSTPLVTLRGDFGEIDSVAFSPDSRSLATGCRDSSVILWDTATHELLATLKGHTEGVTNVAFLPDGRCLATGSEDGTVILWDTATHKPLATLKEHTEAVRAVAVSPDGKTLATGGDKNAVILWDTATHKPLATLRQHTLSITSAAFSPDGRRLATGSWDKTIILWDTATHKPVSTLVGHSVLVQSMEFLLNGSVLASAGLWDNTAMLWDTATGERLGSIKLPEEVQAIRHHEQQIFLTFGSTVVVTSLATILLLCEKTLMPTLLTFEAYVQALELLFLREQPELFNVPALYRLVASSDWEWTLYAVGRYLGAVVRANDPAIVQKFVDAIVCSHKRTREAVDTRPYQYREGFLDRVCATLDLVSPLSALLSAFPEQFLQLLENLPLFPVQATRLHEADLAGESWAVRGSMSARVCEGLVREKNGGSHKPLVEHCLVAFPSVSAHPRTVAFRARQLVQDKAGSVRAKPRKNAVVPAETDTASQQAVSTSKHVHVLRSSNAEGSWKCTGCKLEAGESPAPKRRFSCAAGCMFDLCEACVRDDTRSSSFLQTLVAADDPRLFGNINLRALLKQKWDAYGRAKHVLSFVWYLVGLLALSALSVLLPTSASLDIRERFATYGTSTSEVRARDVMVCVCCALVLATTLRQAQHEAVQAWYSPGKYLRSFWNVLDLVHMGLAVPAIVLFLLGLRSVEVVLAIAVYLRWFGILHFLQPFKATGALVRMVVQITWDIRFFMFILLIAVAAGANSFYVLMRTQCHAASEASAALNCTAMYSGSLETALDGMFDMLILGNLSPSDFAVGSYAPLLKLLYALSMIFVSIILLNLLIALMGNSYERIQEQSAIEMLKLRAEILAEQEMFMSNGECGSERLFPRYIHAVVPKSGNTATGDPAGGSESESVKAEVRAVEESVKRAQVEVKTDIRAMEESVRAVQESVKAVEGNAKASHTEVQADIRAVEESVKAIEVKMAELCVSIEALRVLVASSRT